MNLELAKFDMKAISFRPDENNTCLDSHLHDTFLFIILLPLAQKRQDQRDERRYQTNPNRSQAEEDDERWRKQQQALNRGAWADPYDTNYGNPNYAQDREDHRFYDHAPYGEGWNYIAWP